MEGPKNLHTGGETIQTSNLPPSSPSSHPTPGLAPWLIVQVQAMEREFLRRGANLEVVKYGGEALHAFTRPEKTGQADKDAGLSYCEHADEDSWRRVVTLLREELG